MFQCLRQIKTTVKCFLGGRRTGKFHLILWDYVKRGTISQIRWHILLPICIKVLEVGTLWSKDGLHVFLLVLSFIFLDFFGYKFNLPKSCFKHFKPGLIFFCCFFFCRHELICSKQPRRFSLCSQRNWNDNVKKCVCFTKASFLEEVISRDNHVCYSIRLKQKNSEMKINSTFFMVKIKKTTGFNVFSSSSWKALNTRMMSPKSKTGCVSITTQIQVQLCISPHRYIFPTCSRSILKALHQSWTRVILIIFKQILMRYQYFCMKYLPEKCVMLLN